jgi:glutathione S-transferase
MSEFAPQTVATQPTITILSRRSSSSAQKVFWALEELGVDYRQIDAGRSFGVVDTPEYLAKNPNGLVPTLETSDGFVLWESNAIVRYLAASHGAGSLWPEDPAARALTDRWMDWADTTAKPAINPLFSKLVMRWEPSTEAEIAADIERSDKVLKRLAGVIGGQRYIAGDTLTIGDIPLGMILNRWFQLPIERPALPAVESYYARLSERPAYRRNVIDAPVVI